MCMLVRVFDGNLLSQYQLWLGSRKTKFTARIPCWLSINVVIYSGNVEDLKISFLNTCFCILVNPNLRMMEVRLCSSMHAILWHYRTTYQVVVKGWSKSIEYWSAKFSGPRWKINCASFLKSLYLSSNNVQSSIAV